MKIGKRNSSAINLSISCPPKSLYREIALLLIAIPVSLRKSTLSIERSKVPPPKSITKIFYRGAHCVVLAYDITRLDTFLNLETWLREVKQQIDPQVVVILIGNMKDREEHREVTVKQAEEFR